MSPQLIQERVAQLSTEYREFVLGNFVDATVRAYAKAFAMENDARDVFENGLMLYLLLFFDQAAWTDFIIDECGFKPSLAARIVTDITETMPPSLVYNLNQVYQDFQNATDQKPGTTESDIMPSDLASVEAHTVVTDTDKDSPSHQQSPVSAPTVPATNTATHTELDRMPVTPPRSSAQLASMPTPTTSPAPAPQVPTEPTWPSAPKNPADIEPVRTMNTDTDRIQGLAANQERYSHLHQDEEEAKETIRSISQSALLRQHPPIVDTPNFSDSDSPQQSDQ